MKSKFITIGQTLQQMSLTKDEANDRFAISCKICVRKKVGLKCNKCPIEAANVLKVAALDSRVDDVNTSK